MTAPTRAETAALREALADVPSIEDEADNLIVGMIEAYLSQGPGFRGPYEDLGEIVEPLVLDALGSARRDGAQIANDAANTRADRAEAEPAALKARIATLLKVIEAGKVETAFALADEAEHLSTWKSRRIRLENIRNALEGVGDVEARKALGLLVETIDGEPVRAALSEGATDV